MSDTVLTFDNTIIPQETYYWCGPASCQVALSCRGIGRSEQDLARRLGTTTNGTNHIGLIRDVLNAELGGVYVTRQIPGNDATPAQRDLLWADITKSIAAGFAVVVNVMVPSSNYPRATRGPWPAYSGGMVYHYFTVVGFNQDTREVAVADSGFRPFFYWMDVTQLASCIAGKGYTAAPNVAPPPLVSQHPVADRELGQRYPSRSRYRSSDQPVETAVGFALNIDAMMHEMRTEGLR